MDRLADKVALITGVASGIGLATAQRFVREGALIAGIDLVEPDEQIQQSIGCTANACEYFSVDVTDEPAVEAAVAAIKDKFGRIDVLVNSAGVPSFGLTQDVTVDEWDRVMNVNVKGSFLLTKHVSRTMIEQKSGSIIHIASVEGLDGLSGQITYGTSKGAVIQMTRNMAADFAEHGIRVNCVCPGGVETPMTAALNDESLKAVKEQMEALHLMKRFCQPEEIANAVLFLASDEASFITGHPLVVDGGWTAGVTLTV